MLMSNLVSNHTLTLEEFVALLYPKVCFLGKERSFLLVNISPLIPQSVVQMRLYGRKPAEIKVES